MIRKCSSSDYIYVLYVESGCGMQAKKIKINVNPLSQNTYPPEFVNAAQEGPVATPAGDRALERGRWANARRKAAPRDSGRTGQIPQGFPTLQGRRLKTYEFICLFILEFILMYRSWTTSSGASTVT